MHASTKHKSKGAVFYDEQEIGKKSPLLRMREFKTNPVILLQGANRFLSNERHLQFTTNID